MISSGFIVWTDELVTGVAAMDEQHRILINSINDANTRLIGHASAEMLEQISRDLLSYALYHFETEEEIMYKTNYAAASPEGAEEHLKQHREFSNRVVTMREGIKAGNPVSREELIDFLQDWLVKHILNVDKRLAEYVLNREADRKV